MYAQYTLSENIKSIGAHHIFTEFIKEAPSLIVEQNYSGSRSREAAFCGSSG
jgi:hypothetical protein